MAIALLQIAKTLGPDGLPADVYKTNSEILIPHFHKLLQMVLEEDCLPPCMSEAVIVVVPKPCKDPEFWHPTHQSTQCGRQSVHQNIGESS